ncbi:MAG: hypothetical protein MJZ19_07680 [Paludibacteraceae bacterium]|nr:hypothetical protein [Paludibacteraceae bacterium]
MRFKNVLNIVLGGFLALSSVSVVAQDAKDPKAMSLLDKAYKVVDGNNSYSIKFTLDIKNNQSNKSQKMKGSVDMKAEKFKLSVAGVDTYFDGTTEYVYIKDNNEVNISTPDKEQLKSLNPLYILRSYKDGYKMKYIGTDKTQSGNIEIVDMFPEDLKSKYARVTLSLDSATLLPVCILVQGKDGVNTIVVVDEMKKAVFADSDFVFDAAKHKDVEVIDLR